MYFVEGLRLFLVALGIALGIDIGNRVATTNLGHDVSIIIGVLVGYVLGGVVGRLIERSVGKVTRRLKDISPAEVISSAVLSTAFIVVAAVAGLPILIFVKPEIAYPVVLILAWVFAYIGIRVGSAKAQQIIAVLGLPRSLAPGTEVLDQEALIVDSSAIMDRSFWVLARNNLLPGDVVVPNFVIEEVKSFLDVSDPVISKRARAGLEVLDLLRQDFGKLVIAEEVVPQADSVDEKVLILAQKLKGRIATCSNKIASQAGLKGLKVVDLRKLAGEIVPEHPVGECFEIELVKDGSQPGQAIGYLSDGDMVVVNDASHMIGKGSVMVEVIGSRRTSQGVLIFAKIANY